MQRDDARCRSTALLGFYTYRYLLAASCLQKKFNLQQQDFAGTHFRQSCIQDLNVHCMVYSAVLNDSTLVSSITFQSDEMVVAVALITVKIIHLFVHSLPLTNPFRHSLIYPPLQLPPPPTPPPPIPIFTV